MEGMNNATLGGNTGAENAGGNKELNGGKEVIEKNEITIGTEPGNGNQEGQKTFTQEDFDKALQSETDKRVNSAIETAKAKWQAEYEQKLEAEKAEAARLAKMTAEERSKAEFEKQKSDFEAEREKYNKELLEFDVTKKLAEKKIDVKFAPYITALGSENTDEHIKTLEGLLAEYRQSVVNELTKGNTPPANNQQQQNPNADPFLMGFGM